MGGGEMIRRVGWTICGQEQGPRRLPSRYYRAMVRSARSTKSQVMPVRTQRSCGILLACDILANVSFRETDHQVSAHSVPGELTTLRGSWRPRHRPPLSLDLPSLPTEASISIVPVGNDLLDWSHRPESDLDPGLDAIPDFQTSWHVATGKGWIHDEPAGTSKAGRITPESAKTAVEDESSQTRRIRKGKFKALNPLHTSMTIIAEPIDPPDVPLDALEVPTVLRPVVNQATGHHESALGLIVEPPSAREKPGSWPSPRSRKAWWREEIGSSSSYGRIWEILPRVSIPPS